MARQPGSANFSGTIEALAGGPLDARSIVQTKADLTANGSFAYPYIGMETYVVAESKKYRLIGADPTVLANWEEIGSASIDIDDAIDETSENPVQNKVIAEALDGKADLDEDGKVDASQLRERELHQAEYDALTEEEKMNGTTYYIDDSIDEGSATAVCGFTPIGTIISVMGTVAPRNYLACNGQIVNIDTYPELANYFEQQFGSKNKFGGDGVTTFGIPDLRGEFLRGAGTNSHENQGSGMDVGIHQDGTFIRNTENSNASYKKIQCWGVDTWGSTFTENVDSFKPADKRIDIVGASASVETSQTTNYGSFATRPTNTSVLYCIAVRNIYVDARYDYSTDEKVVGTWIDGKPIYQKTVVGVSPITATDGTIANGESIAISEVCDQVVKVEVTIENNNDPIGTGQQMIMTNSQYFVKVNCERGTYPKFGVRPVNNCTRFNGLNLYITVQYTKTTD